MNNVQQYNPGQLPDIFRDMMPQAGGVNDDLSSGVGVGFPHLSIKGKVFHIHDGDEVELMTNPDSPNMPAQYLDVSLIKAARNMSKVFYLKTFTEGSEDKPDCFSNDGITPDPSSPQRQANACAACQWNQWGSRQSNDGEGTGKGKACQDARRMAVSLVEDIDVPMLLRIPPVTLKELAAYGNMLAKRGVPYQAVVTRIYFDHQVAYPKLMFQAVRFLNNEEAQKVKDMMDGDDLVDQIIGATAIAAQQAAQQSAPALAGQMPQQFAQEQQATQVVQGMQQQQPPMQQQHPPQQAPGGGAGMFDTPQQTAAPQQTTAPEQPAPARRSRKKAAPAEQPQQTAAPVNNVVQMQPQQTQQSQVLQQGAANEGVQVVSGELANGIDTLLGGLPDVPNI